MGSVSDVVGVCGVATRGSAGVLCRCVRVSPNRSVVRQRRRRADVRRHAARQRRRSLAARSSAKTRNQRQYLPHFRRTFTFHALSEHALAFADAPSSRAR